VTDNSPLTASEAAARLNVSEEAARRLIDDRKLHHVRVGLRLVPVRSSDLDRSPSEHTPRT